MGFDVEIGGLNYELESFNVVESATPLSSDDSSGQVGTISLGVKKPDPFLDDGLSGVYTNLVTNPSMESVVPGSTTIYTNLVTNPSMEAASGVVTVRTNLVTNPSFEVNTTGWQAQICTATRVTTQSYVGTASAEVVASSTSSAFNMLPGTAAISASATYTASAWVKGEAGKSIRMQFIEYNSGNVFIAQTIGSDVVMTGSWQRLSVTRTMTAGGANAIIFLLNRTIGAHTFYVDAAQIEVGSTASDYFDGSTSASGDFTYAWSGTAHASTSLQRGVPVTGYTAASAVSIQSSEWSSSGTKSLRQIPTSSTASANYTSLTGLFTAGKTYTVKAKVRLTAPITNPDAGLTGRISARTTGAAILATSNAPTNAAGVYDVQVTFTAATNSDSIRLEYRAVAGSGELWWDDLIVVEGTYTGDYFDGSTSEVTGWDYAWTGTANASTSTAKASVVTVRENLAKDPRATVIDFATGPGWRDDRWFGAAPAAGTYSLVTGATDGPMPSIKTYLRKTWTTAPAAIGNSGDTGFDHSIYTSLGTLTPVTAGQIITASSYLRPSVNRNVYMRLYFYDAAGVGLSNSGSTPILATAGQWTRINWTATAPANAAYVRAISDSNNLSTNGAVNWAVGSTFDGTALLIEQHPSLGEYFDGETLENGDFNYAWSGTANASTSLERGVPLAGVSVGGGRVAYQSSQWSSTGTKSLRITPIGTAEQSRYGAVVYPAASMQTGKTYTVLAKLRLDSPQSGSLDAHARKIYLGTASVIFASSQAPNVAGVHSLSLTFTYGGTGEVRLTNGASIGNGDVWWDDVLIVEGEYNGDYFDGNTPDVIGIQYVWTGTENQSTSIASIFQNLFKEGAHLLLGESVRLTDSKKGFTLGTIKSVTDNSGAIVNIMAESRLGLLNVYDIQAQPFVGRLDDLFDYYMSLAGISTDVFIDPSIAATSVVFPGWFGELWFNLKRLAASIGAEISLVSGVILLRPVRTREAIRGRDVTRSLSAGGGQLAQNVEVIRYDNQQITNQLVYPIGGWSEDVAVINVNAGEYLEQVLELSASVSSVQQPVMQTFVAKNYVASSVFTVVGDDGLPVPVAQWNANGGSLTVAINDDTTSLTVKIQAPTNIANSDGEPIEVYSISLSSSDSTGRYSTLRIVGSGVAFNKTTYRFPTGLTAQQTATEVGTVIDNPFLSSLQEVYNAGTRAAKRYTGAALAVSGDVVVVNALGDSGVATYPSYSFVQDSFSGKTYNQAQEAYVGKTYDDIQTELFDVVQNDFENQVFGNVAGARVWDTTSKRYYRIREATLNPGTISFSAEDDLLYDDMQTANTGSTYANLQSKYFNKTYFKANLMGMS